MSNRIETVRRHVDQSRRLSGNPSKNIVLSPIEKFSIDDYRKDLKRLKKELIDFIQERKCHPILLRLAWHDAGTYDSRIPTFPDCGGANGSIHFKDELDHGANAGLEKAIRFLQPFHHRYPNISWADLIQLAGALSVELAGGPKIPMRYGRMDAVISAKEGALPDPFPKNPIIHVRDTFQRLGMTSKETVALIGAHTIGRAFKERSGATSYGYGADGATKYTSAQYAKDNGSVGMLGGQSWTSNWLKFDNTYFKKEYVTDSALLWLPTDEAISQNDYKRHFEAFAADNDEFFSAYAAAHKKLSESGSAFMFYVCDI